MCVGMPRSRRNSTARGSASLTWLVARLYVRDCVKVSSTSVNCRFRIVKADCTAVPCRSWSGCECVVVVDADVPSKVNTRKVG